MAGSARRYSPTSRRSAGLSSTSRTCVRASIREANVWDPGGLTGIGCHQRLPTRCQGTALVQIPEGGEDRLDDLWLVREGDLLERLAVGHRQVGAGDAPDRGVEVVERLLLHER